nr:hypothetical protein [Tanacetum cinerariifolium]
DDGGDVGGCSGMAVMVIWCGRGGHVVMMYGVVWMFGGGVVAVKMVTTAEWWRLVVLRCDGGEVVGRWLGLVVGSPEKSAEEEGGAGKTFDLAVHDFDWFFDEMKLVVELTFISRNG